MNRFELKKAFKENKRVYGTLVASPSPKWAAEIHKTGVDFVFIDSEHMPLDPSTRSWMCRCYSAMNLAPIIRVPCCNPSEVFMALESGAEGIISPYTETMDEVKTLIGAVKYRPLKGQKLKDVLDKKISLSEKEKTYLDNYNKGNLLILNIESCFALENLDKLLSFTEVDAIFIGPHDLSINMGIPEEYENPDFEKNVETIIKKCISKGIGVGNHYSGDIEKQLQWAKKGMNIIIWNSDIARFVQAISSDFNYIKHELGDKAYDAVSDVTI